MGNAEFREYLIGIFSSLLLILCKEMTNPPLKGEWLRGQHLKSCSFNEIMEVIHQQPRHNYVDACNKPFSLLMTPMDVGRNAFRYRQLRIVELNFCCVYGYANLSRTDRSEGKAQWGRPFRGECSTKGKIRDT